VVRVLLCSGKVYFDLAEAREKLARQDVALLRLEQLYPLPDELLGQALAPYPREAPVVYVQEEPENMGAWPYLKGRFGHELPGGRRLEGVARRPSASPATGSATSHRREQQQLVERAFAGLAGLTDNGDPS
jgi:2-oxoglutarate dehydrogenase E1 component